MGRKADPKKWEGFAKIDSPKRGARCLKCTRFLSGTTGDNLSFHRDNCTGTPVSKSERTLSRKKRRALHDCTNAPSPKQARTHEEHPPSQICNLRGASRGTDANKEEKEKLLLKFCLLVGVDLSLMRHPISRKLFKTFDSNFEIPDLETFRESVLPNVIQDLQMEEETRRYMDILIVAKASSKLLSYVITRDGKYSLVECADLNDNVHGNSDEDADEDYEVRRSEAVTFCDSSVISAFKKFGIVTKFVLYTGLGLLSEEGEARLIIDDGGNVKTFPYLRSIFFADILKKLLTFKLPSGQPISVVQRHVRYEYVLTELVENTRKSDYSIADALEDIFKLFKEDTLNVNPNAMNIFEQYLSPFHFLTNHLDPRYRGKCFSNYDDYHTRMIDLLNETLDDEASFFAHGKYKSGSGVFNHLFDNPKYSKEKVWRIAASASKELSDLALDLIKVPAAANLPAYDFLHGVFDIVNIPKDDNTMQLASSVFVNGE
ncbi:hypothetical protein QAD02_020750 [Eretmocerus hayati]|uniref:Uncharacterized protein n=1 Tax=Eretmocerus hayati TaxID=131215 RepID=A0ACC2PRH7_9HYME|nr:hypothetical protein QAD02_020750 [Eretmocerus hayati]